MGPVEQATPKSLCSGAEMQVLLPAGGGGGAPASVPFHQAWTGLMAPIRELLEPDGKELATVDVGHFWAWLWALNFFISGIALASFSAEAQPLFQAVVDEAHSVPSGLATNMRALRERLLPRRCGAVEAVEGELRDLLATGLRAALAGLRATLRQAAGEDAVRGEAAYAALARHLEPELPTKRLEDAQTGAKATDGRRLLTLRRFQSDERRQVLASKDVGVDELRRLLVRQLGFPKGIKLIGRTSSVNTLVTLKASDPLPHSGEVLVHGVDNLRPSRPLPPLSEERSLEEQLWAYRGVVPRVTREQAYEMCADLKAGFAAKDFQEKLRRIQREHVIGGGRASASKSNSLAELALTVQANVLPKYGYEASLKGVVTMRSETRAMFATDAVLMQMHKDINALLGFRDETVDPEVKLLETPRFDVSDTEAWKHHLAEHGFVVLAAVASPQTEVPRARALLWDFIEESDRAGVIRRGDVDTWDDSDNKDCGWPAGKDDGIIHDHGVGQSELLWFVRGLKSVRRAFGAIWQTDRLVTSFDGAGAFRPYGRKEAWRTRKRHWYHVDQAHTKSGLHCIQGQVTLTDVTEATGGLVVVPGSHKFHSDILRSYDYSEWDFIALRKHDRVLFEGGGGPRLVAARAGDALLWDSRTVHCNTLPLRDDPVQSGRELIRIAVYVCMTPAAWCSEQTLERRRQGFENQVTTSHWPHEYHEMECPETLQLRRFDLNEEQLQLLEGHGGCSFAEGLPCGLPSFLPERRYGVVATSGAEVFRAPTFEWERPLARLPSGGVVRGHAFGHWLRLRDEDARQAVVDVIEEMGPGPYEERWVFLGDDCNDTPPLEALTP